MESVQKLVDPNAPGSLNAAGDPQLAVTRLRQVLRGDDKARYPMSDAARAQLDNVRASLLRRSISDNKIGPSGSNTAADLMAQDGLPSLIFGKQLGAKATPTSRLVGAALGSLLGAHAGIPAGGEIGAGLGALFTDALAQANRRVIGRVGSTAASAPQTADALERYLQSRQVQPSPIQQLLFGAQPASLPAPVASGLPGRP